MASTQFPAALNPKEDDIQKLLACQVHIGSKNLEPAMERYVWKRRNDGVYLINLQKTWEKLVLAARIIAAIEHPGDVCVISARPYGQRAVLKFAKYIGAQALAARYTPGTFTNQIQEKFMEPRLLILTDPRTDHQSVKESSYVNIPTIAFCHTDTPTRFVDCVIPCNNKGKNSIGLMWWMLAREVLYLKKGIQRGSPWDVMVDLFFFRDPTEEEKEEAAEEQPFGQKGTTEGADWQTGGAENWDTTGGSTWGATGTDWGSTEAATPAAVATTTTEGASWDTSSLPTGTSTWDQQHE